MDEYAVEKRTNSIVRIGKSEAEEITNKRWRSRCHTADTNYRHEALRVLSAIAELLVSFTGWLA